MAVEASSKPPIMRLASPSVGIERMIDLERDCPKLFLRSSLPGRACASSRTVCSNICFNSGEMPRSSGTTFGMPASLPCRESTRDLCNS